MTKKKQTKKKTEKIISPEAALKKLLKENTLEERITEDLKKRLKNPKRVKPRPLNLQGVRQGFREYQEYITGELNKYACRQNDSEVARDYITYRQLIQSWMKIAKSDCKNCPDFPEPPTLIEDNYYAGLISLAKYCEKVGGGENKREENETPKRSHSEDFTSVVWDKNRFSFTKTQAAVIGLLWNEYEKGTWNLGQETIGEKIGSEMNQYRLIQTFEKGRHPAWGTLIIAGEKRGTFRLADTIQQKPTKKKKTAKKARKN